MSKRVENQKRGYRTASEYAAQAAARIQINENGYIDIVSNIKIKKKYSKILNYQILEQSCARK